VEVKDLYHEVLFTEWIPKTLDLEGATFEFSARESSEVGELVINFNNIIDLITDYGHREYRIMIEFDNEYMFNYDMGMTVENGD